MYIHSPLSLAHNTSPSMFTFPCFLAQDGPLSSHTFPTLESAISLRSPGSFQWQMIFTIQGLGIKCGYC